MAVQQATAKAVAGEDGLPIVRLLARPETSPLHLQPHRQHRSGSTIGLTAATADRHSPARRRRPGKCHGASRADCRRAPQVMADIWQRRAETTKINDGRLLRTATEGVVDETRLYFRSTDAPSGTPVPRRRLRRVPQRGRGRAGPDASVLECAAADGRCPAPKSGEAVKVVLVRKDLNPVWGRCACPFAKPI